MNETRIYTALTALTHRDADDSFVIIQEPRSKKFAQFYYGRGLIMNVPLVALVGQEIDDAHNFFREFGEEMPWAGRCENLETGKVSYSLSFDHDFGQNARDAAKATISFFRQVYGIPPDIDLVITEN